eukprot:208242-Hanusia_phi.AAC.3
MARADWLQSPWNMASEVVQVRKTRTDRRERKKGWEEKERETRRTSSCRDRSPPSGSLGDADQVSSSGEREETRREEGGGRRREKEEKGGVEGREGEGISDTAGVHDFSIEGLSDFYQAGPYSPSKQRAEVTRLKPIFVDNIVALAPLYARFFPATKEQLLGHADNSRL